MKGLRMEDMKDIKPQKDWSLFHLLVAVNETAEKILDNEEQSSRGNKERDDQKQSNEAKGQEIFVSHERKLLLQRILDMPDDGDKDCEEIRRIPRSQLTRDPSSSMNKSSEFPVEKSKTRKDFPSSSKCGNGYKDCEEIPRIPRSQLTRDPSSSRNKGSESPVEKSKTRKDISSSSKRGYGYEDCEEIQRPNRSLFIREPSSPSAIHKDSEFQSKKSETREERRKGKRAIRETESSEDEKEENKKKPKKSLIPRSNNNNRNTKGIEGPYPPPPLPQPFQNAILRVAEGKSVSGQKLVIQKMLTKTDLSTGHNRFAIPFRQIIEAFLTEEEAEFLEQRGKKEVVLIEPSTEICMVKLTRWDMKKPKGSVSSYYVLNGTWNNIHKRNGLRQGMFVQLWCVRIERELGFAMVNLSPGLRGGKGEEEDEEDEDDAGEEQVEGEWEEEELGGAMGLQD